MRPYLPIFSRRRRKVFRHAKNFPNFLASGAGIGYNVHMERLKKYDKKNKDYYLSELDEGTLKKRALIIRVLSVAAAVVYVPFIVMYITPGYMAPTAVSDSYSGLSMYMALTFVLPVALVWCAVMSFLSYTPGRETLVRKSPPFGFRVVPYVGMLVSLVLSLGFAVYHTVLMAITGGIASDAAAAALLWVCFALVAGYYTTGFLTYRACVLIESEPDEEEETKRVILPAFRLSDEELEQGKSAFAPSEKKNKDKKDPPDGSGDRSEKDE